MKLGLVVKTGASRVMENVQNWWEVYFWVPFSLFLMWSTIHIHYYMVGRPTGEDSWDWLVGIAPRFTAVVLSIVLVSISREAFGSWMNREDRLASPIYASVQTICSTALCLFFAWLLSH